MKTSTIDHILCIIIWFVLSISCIYLYDKSKKRLDTINELNKEIEYYKEAAKPSGEVIDSIKYNIQYRDTTILNIKKKYVEDVEIIKNMPDSSAVNLFHELVWAN